MLVCCLSSTATAATAAAMECCLRPKAHADCLPCGCQPSRPPSSPRAPAPDDQRGTTVLTVILAAVFILAYVLSMIFMF